MLVDPVDSQESLEEEAGGSESEKKASRDGRDMGPQAKECRQQWKWKQQPRVSPRAARGNK